MKIYDLLKIKKAKIGQTWYFNFNFNVINNFQRLDNRKKKD